MDADAEMRGELRVDDPMVSYFAAKLPDELTRAAGKRLDKVHGGDLAGASGFSVPQEVPDHSWMRRGVAPLPNRVNIKPGRHWDGVHRSNGFEKTFVFGYANRAKAREREKYLSYVDM